MAKKKPTTKAGKQQKMQKVMEEYMAGGLKSSSGQPVTKRSQAVAIGLSESGQSKKRPKKKAKK